jgi:hypothetical protein
LVGLRRVKLGTKRGILVKEQLAGNEPSVATARTATGHMAAIAVVSAAFTAPTVLFGFANGDRMHLFWAKYFAQQISAGDLFPKWLMGMNSGLGSPTFYFYGCAAYYLTTPFELMLPAGAYGWQPVGWSAVCATALSGLAVYLWLGRRYSTHSALAAALVYVVLPYHLRIDFLERFAFAEYWAFVWMPLAFYFLTRGSLSGTAISYALVVTTHPPTALLFSVLPAAYGGVLALEQRRLRPLIVAAAGSILGIALAAFYLFPALMTQHNVSMIDMFGALGDPRNHFLFTSVPKIFGAHQQFFEGWLAGMSELTGWTATLAVLAIGSAVCRPRLTLEPLFWAVTVGIAFFLCTALSRPVWDLIPPLHNVQFPWRVHTLVCVALAAIVACAVDQVRRHTRRRLRLSLMATFCVLLAVQTLQTARVVRWNIQTGPAVPERLVIMDYPEYRPRWVPRHVFTPSGIRELAESSPPVRIIAGVGQLHVRNWGPRGIVVETDSRDDLLLQVKQFYYPGWVARLGDGSQARVSTSPENGLVAVAVPGGFQVVRLTLEAETIGRMGFLISGVAAAILATAGMRALWFAVRCRRH